MKSHLLSIVLVLLFAGGVARSQEKEKRSVGRPSAPDYYDVLLSNAPLPQQSHNWEAIERIFGRAGSVQGDVFKVSFPRSDLTVRVGNVVLEPGLALTSWIAFKPMESDTMVMGDLVLLESEIRGAMSRLLENGLEVSAVHNHILRETPKVMYMHFEGHGDGVKLAEAMKSVLRQTHTPLASPPVRKEIAPSIEWGQVESILGYPGKHNGRLLQFGIPRTETIREAGMEIPPFMGMATGINFQKEGTRAVTTGDFVLLADEVNPVVHALVENGIAVTAVHNHMLNESPRLFFVHFWAYDDPEKLARALHGALEKTNSARGK